MYRKALTPITLCFSLLFLTIGLSKYFGLADFQAGLRQTPLIDAYADLVSYLLPGILVSLGLFLLTEQKRRLALGLTVALMLGFTGFSLYILYLAPHIPCSCAGISRHFSWQQQLYINLALTAIAGVAFYLTFHQRRAMRLVKV
jgi:hypothetical protein